MNVEWIISYKTEVTNFLNNFKFVNSKEVGQIFQKISTLAIDPTPDQKTRKLIKHLYLKKGDKQVPLLRLRSGIFRIFYTYAIPIISILKVELRRDAYDSPVELETPEKDTLDIDIDIEETDFKDETKNESYQQLTNEILNKEILKQFGIPEKFHEEILKVKEQDLLDCPVPEEYLELILDYLFPKPVEELINQPDYVLEESQDFQNIIDGELACFLLKLSKEQEIYSKWNTTDPKPTLLKGGPGSGKTTIAFHRLIQRVKDNKDQGKSDDTILFCTYTNALVNYSENLLEKMLGDDLKDVKISTADKIATDILRGFNYSLDVAQDNLLEKIVRNSREDPRISAIETSSIAHLTDHYLADEILLVIQGNDLQTLNDYINNKRVGRLEFLSDDEKKVVWTISEILTEELNDLGKTTFQEIGKIAYKLVKDEKYKLKYDSIIIDEVQDLDISSLKLLFSLCKNKNNLFLTADVNQSIFSSNFSWEAIIENLDTTLEVNSLEGNYRSTKEISMAASNYLGDDFVDKTTREQTYINNGDLPIYKSVETIGEEIISLSNFIKEQSRALRLPVGSAAVLCPTESVGLEISRGLNEQGIKAEFMRSRDIKVTDNNVKVLPLKAAKGLEYPIVAIAGLRALKPSRFLNYSSKQRTERLNLERRTNFVGMTRAMRSMMICVPTKCDEELLGNFDSKFWEMR